MLRKYLMLVLDSKLRWKKHVATSHKFTIAKATKALVMIVRLMATH